MAGLELEDEMPAMPETWDPEPHKREYFTHAVTGDRAYKVIREGRWCVRWDRPNDPSFRVFKPDDWVPLRQAHPISDAHAGQIAHAADRQLCISIGLHGAAEKDWLSLSEEQRIAWMRVGPQRNPLRKALWEAVMSALAPEMG